MCVLRRTNQQSARDPKRERNVLFKMRVVKEVKDLKEGSG